ncbi:hypothetical protein VP01_915g2 [Puccinia sorghi]|uniref:Uncharacterized protein n=1 Tax=Puccinia sorghi TaxID=27349 RepID=A0A0L6U822_9BASI|nr:hypothetical protein VP01_915g2 [Puccinia sorghi]
MVEFNLVLEAVPSRKKNKKKKLGHHHPWSLWANLDHPRMVGFPQDSYASFHDMNPILVNCKIKKKVFFCFAVSDFGCAPAGKLDISFEASKLAIKNAAKINSKNPNQSQLEIHWSQSTTINHQSSPHQISTLSQYLPHIKAQLNNNRSTPSSHCSTFSSLSRLKTQQLVCFPSLPPYLAPVSLHTSSTTKGMPYPSLSLSSSIKNLFGYDYSYVCVYFHFLFPNITISSFYSAGRGVLKKIPGLFLADINVSGIFQHEQKVVVSLLGQRDNHAFTQRLKKEAKSFLFRINYLQKWLTCGLLRKRYREKRSMIQEDNFQNKTNQKIHTGVSFFFLILLKHNPIIQFQNNIYISTNNFILCHFLMKKKIFCNYFYFGMRYSHIHSFKYYIFQELRNTHDFTIPIVRVMHFWVIFQILEYYHSNPGVLMDIITHLTCIPLNFGMVHFPLCLKTFKLHQKKKQPKTILKIRLLMFFFPFFNNCLYGNSRSNYFYIGILPVMTVIENFPKHFRIIQYTDIYLKIRNKEGKRIFTSFSIMHQAKRSQIAVAILTALVSYKNPAQLASSMTHWSNLWAANTPINAKKSENLSCHCGAYIGEGVAAGLSSCCR